MPLVQLRSDRRIYFEENGCGEPLVFISGVGQDHAMWRAQVAAFQDHFRCITFDNPGVGRSSLPWAECSLRGFAEDVVELLDALNVARVHICGFSMGGAIAAIAAGQLKGRVVSLSLHSTFFRAYPSFVARFETLAAALDAGDEGLWARLGMIYASPAQFLDEDVTLAAAEMERRRQSFRSLTQSERSGLRRQYRALIEMPDIKETISTKCLITVGELDVLTPKRFSRDIAAQVPEAQLRVFPGLFHKTPTLAPRSFNNVLMAFLRERV